MRPTKITGFPWAVLLTSLTAAKATGQLSTPAPPYADAGVSNTVSSYNLDDSARCLGNPNDPEEKPTISHVIHNFKVMLVRLGLTQYIDELYFSELLEEGTEKELHAKVNITRQVFKASYVDKANMAYSGQTKEGRRIPKTKSAGEEFGFLRSFQDNYVMLGIISGHSDWLPSDQDSTSICDTMVQHTQNLYANLVDKTDISAYDILGLAWRTMPQEHNFDPGCFSALYAIINPRKEIELANLGQAWAGLYRRGELIHSTKPRMHEDWFPYQLCKVGGTHAPKYHDDNFRDSRIYTWESQPGDILIVVSGGVREVLQYNQIQYAFMSANQREKDGEHVMASAHEKLSSSAEDFSFVAMDIVQAAKRASGEGRNTDMMAIAMVVE